MKIAIESTDRIVEINAGGGRVPARVWEGKTESGIRVQCLVTRIGAPAGEDLEQFERELKECAPPAAEQMFPPRLVL